MYAFKVYAKIPIYNAKSRVQHEFYSLYYNAKSPCINEIIKNEYNLSM